MTSGRSLALPRAQACCAGELPPDASGEDPVAAATDSSVDVVGTLTAVLDQSLADVNAQDGPGAPVAQ
jgi:hypothetical protein